MNLREISQNILKEKSLSAEALANMLNDKEFMVSFANLMKRITDGKHVNKNPLTEIPDPEMRLYGIHGTYFETKEGLEKYCENRGYSMDDVCALDYLRSVAGCSDVIRTTYRDGRSVFYTAIDEDGYGIYNYERSVYKGEFVWEYNYGKISEMYSAFRDRGIIFVDDIYGKYDERNEQFLKICKVKENK